MNQPNLLNLDNPTLTFGQLCAQRIAQAKASLGEHGAVLRMADVAKIIDDTKKELALAHEGKDVPPPPEAVTAYSASIGYPMDGKKWCDSYALKGWIVSGKTKMKDWKAAVRNWKANGYGLGTIALSDAKSPKTEQKRSYNTF